MRLIDADALKSKVQAQEWKRDPAVMLALDWIYMLINEQPTIDAVPVVRGRWRTWEEQFPDRTTRKKNNLGVFCSACQLHADNMTSYCPNCGAKMESEGST